MKLILKIIGGLLAMVAACSAVAVFTGSGLGGLLGAGLYGAGACLCLERAESMEEDGL